MSNKTFFLLTVAAILVSAVIVGAFGYWYYNQSGTAKRVDSLGNLFNLFGRSA